jgi:hypothetical protein
MSYRALNWAWEADLPTSQKFVLVALADMADEHESCFPGQERLGRMIGATDRTVRAALVKLEESGLISRTQRRGADGMRTSDRYVLHTNRKILPVVESPETDVDLTGNLRQPHRKQLPGNPQRTTREPSDPVGELLEVLWMMWPSSRRSTKKVVALRLKTALKRTDAPTLIEAVKAHTDVWSTWPESDVQYVPLLSTWLNQERWTGAVPQPRSGARLSPVDMGRAAAELLAVEDTRHLRALS